MAGNPVTRSFLVIDVENSSKRANPDVPGMRRTLNAIFDRTMAGSGFSPDSIYTEGTGDGIMAVIDGELLSLLDPGLDTMIAALGEHNLSVDPPDWLRLRIAVHRGLVDRNEPGWSGADLTSTFRLLDAPQVKTVLKRADRAQCVIVVSDSVYSGLIKHGYGNLSASVYAALDGIAGWVRVPGYLIPPVAAEPPYAESKHANRTDSHRRSGPDIAISGNLANLFNGNTIGYVDASVRQDRETNR
jgi:hypothetical protein